MVERNGERGSHEGSVPKVSSYNVDGASSQCILDNDTKPERSSSKLGKGRCPNLEPLNATSFQPSYVLLYLF